MQPRAPTHANCSLICFGGVRVARMRSWREDGFCIMFDLQDRLPARLAVVDLARRFGQGAIFDYAPSSESDRAMVWTYRSFKMQNSSF